MDENLIGYARCSTRGQDLRAQRTALRKLGFDSGNIFIYTDRGHTGRNCQRPGLVEALAAVGEGEALVFTELDRLGRSRTEPERHRRSAVYSALVRAREQRDAPPTPRATTSRS